MFLNDISLNVLERRKALKNEKIGKSQLSPVNAVGSLVACMNLILVKREFLTRKILQDEELDEAESSPRYLVTESRSMFERT